jgi:O-methyltransferase domain/Dimerisation domain
MTGEFTPATTSARLMSVLDSLIVAQALYAVAQLGVADLLKEGPRPVVEMARGLKVNESALYRVLRALAGESVFKETSPGMFANTTLSGFLLTDAPGSIRPTVIFRGSEFFFAPFGEILYSIETGQPARTRMLGMNGFEYLQQHPDVARVFDDAMTNLSELSGPTIASAYDFGAWGSVTDIGGGNGILLASILRAHLGLRGVLADLPHVLSRAQQQGFLGGGLERRSSFEPCDFFREVPSGTRLYIMKNAILDWSDERAQAILANCRRAVPADGALLLIDFVIPNGNSPAPAKIIDIAMLVLTGGKVRTVGEYSHLLASANFRLSHMIETSGLNIIQAIPS